jgi:hypothetical protein
VQGSLARLRGQVVRLRAERRALRARLAEDGCSGGCVGLRGRLELLQRIVEQCRACRLELEGVEGKQEEVVKENEVKEEKVKEEVSLAEEMRRAAEAAVAQQGMVYEPTSGLYYHAASGYYYDSERSLYYDGNSGTWYR